MIYFDSNFLKKMFFTPFSSLRLENNLTERPIFLAVSLTEAVGHANFSSASFHWALINTTRIQCPPVSSTWTANTNSLEQLPVTLKQNYIELFTPLVYIWIDLYQINSSFKIMSCRLLHLLGIKGGKSLCLIQYNPRSSLFNLLLLCLRQPAVCLDHASRCSMPVVTATLMYSWRCHS